MWIGNGLTFLFRVKISAEKTDCSNVSVHTPVYHAFVSFVQHFIVYFKIYLFLFIFAMHVYRFIEFVSLYIFQRTINLVFFIHSEMIPNIT